MVVDDDYVVKVEFHNSLAPLFSFLYSDATMPTTNAGATGMAATAVLASTSSISA